MNNKFKITQIIKGKRDNLSISWDYWDDENDLTQRKAVFLYTPDMDNTDNHSHIELDQEQARILKDWLVDFFKDIDGK